MKEDFRKSHHLQILHQPSSMETYLGAKVKKGSEILVKSSDYSPSKFKLYPTIVEEKDLHGSHSSIPPKVIIIHDVKSFYQCFI